MKPIKLKLFVPVLVALLALTVFSFLCAWGEEEGTLGNSLISVFGTNAFTILRFPTHTLFWEIAQKSFILYFLGLLMNAAMYALLIERLITRLKKTKA